MPIYHFSAIGSLFCHSHRPPAISVLTFFTISLPPYLRTILPFLPFRRACQFFHAPFVRIFGLSGFNISPFRPSGLTVYRFNLLTALAQAVLPFLPPVSIFGQSGFNIYHLPAPYCLYHLSPYLCYWCRKASRPSQPTQPSHAGNTFQPAQTCRPRNASTYIYTTYTSLPR